MERNLKLIGKTIEDLKVISAHLQDSIVHLKDIAHLKRNRIFLIQLNRFMWEDVEKGIFRKSRRVRTVLKFDHVIEVKSKKIFQNSDDKFLDFLALETNIKQDESFEVRLIFAGDSTIRIKSEVLEVTLDDQGEPWETKNEPKHKFK